MTHWTSKIIDLLEADTADLRELAIIAGGDPKTFYLGVDMRGVDVRGQDLRGMVFSPTAYTEMLWDKETNFSDEDLDNDENEQKLYSDVQESCNIIKNISKHEERFACLLNLCINNSDQKNDICNYYDDKSIYVEEMKSRIYLANLFDIDLFGNKTDSNELIKLINHSISSAYPYSRQSVIYYLSKHIGHKQNISKLLKSRAISLRMERQVFKGIIFELEKWKINPNELLMRAKYSEIYSINGKI